MAIQRPFGGSLEAIFGKHLDHLKMRHRLWVQYLRVLGRALLIVLLVTVFWVAFATLIVNFNV